MFLTKKNALLAMSLSILMILIGIFAINGISANAASLSSRTEDEDQLPFLTVEIMDSDTARENFSNGHDVDLAIEKGIANKSIYEKQYLELQSAYRALLNYYLCEEFQTGLNDYQDALDSLSLSFPPIENYDYEIGSFGRNNIYLKNDLYVERLSKEDISLLYSVMDIGGVYASESVLEMIGRTLESIITSENDYGNDDPASPYLSMHSESSWASGNSLIIEIGYEKIPNKDGDILAARYEKEKYQTAIDLADQIEDELSAALRIPVKVIVNCED